MRGFAQGREQVFADFAALLVYFSRNSAKGMHQQKLAVDSGYWPLYRYNPKLSDENKNPFQLDSHGPKIPPEDYIYTEGRYRMLQQSDPEVVKFLLAQAKKSVSHR